MHCGDTLAWTMDPMHGDGDPMHGPHNGTGDILSFGSDISVRNRNYNFQVGRAGSRAGREGSELCDSQG